MDWLHEIGRDAFVMWAVINRSYVRKYHTAKIQGIRQLADQATMSRNTAKKAIATLEGCGLIERHFPTKAPIVNI